METLKTWYWQILCCCYLRNKIKRDRVKFVIRKTHPNWTELEVSRYAVSFYISMKKVIELIGEDRVRKIINEVQEEKDKNE